MNLYLLSNVIVGGCSLLALIISALLFLKPEKPMFAKMITLAIGCVACGRAYEVIRTLMTGKDHTDGFELGFLGIIGSLFFFYSANYGLLDKAIGGREKKNLKHRLLALFAPGAVLAVYAFFIFCYRLKPINTVYGAVLTFVMALSSYYNFKHLILPDSGDGTVKNMRGYNVLALIYTYLCVFEMNALITDNLKANFISCILISIIILLFIPVSVRGNKTWRT